MSFWSMIVTFCEGKKENFKKFYIRDPFILNDHDSVRLPIEKLQRRFYTQFGRICFFYTRFHSRNIYSKCNQETSFQIYTYILI